MYNNKVKPHVKEAGVQRFPPTNRVVLEILVCFYIVVPQLHTKLGPFTLVGPITRSLGYYLLLDRVEDRCIAQIVKKRESISKCC